MRKKLLHIVIWLILIYLMFASISLFLSWQLALVRAVTGAALMAGMFYVSGWLVTEEFLIRRRQPALFILFIVLAISVFSVLRVVILGLLPGNMIAFPGRFSENWATQDELIFGRIAWINDHFGIERTPLLIGILMNLILSVMSMLIRLLEYKDQKELESREKLQRSQEAQILYLKSQVNPHFLFNTLNNLYGLTYAKSELAPQMVLGLSDTIRYMIYETDQKLVSVEKELSFIRNYLELEKMRISYPENIRVSVKVLRLNAFIPPLLLLPFIENCFKHGNIGKEGGWMELDIWDGHDNFYFVCKNSYRERQKAKSSVNSGLGLTNVRKRLDLIFGEKYELRILKQNDEYMVSLQFPAFSQAAEW